MKTPIAKNFAIVMATSKQLLANYLMKPPSNCEVNHLVGLYVKVVMDEFCTLVSLNCCNFVSSSKHFIRNGMGIMDGVMFLGQSKDIVFVFKILVGLP